jgi:photosystem II stability/assembly factor-like uncharacterized protein
VKNILTLVKSVLVSIFIILNFQIISVAQQPEVININTTETLRSILVARQADGRSRIIVGTNRGRLFYQNTNADFITPDFLEYEVLPKTQKVIRDIAQASNNDLYALKQDGLYLYDKASNEWSLLDNLDKFRESKSRDSEAELRGMAFAGTKTNRLCIVGGNYKNDFLSKEILKCTNSLISRFWNEGKLLGNRTYQELQLSSIFFDSTGKNGWTVGTANDMGVIWSTTDGGESWVEDKIDLPSTLFSLDGNKKMVYAIGTDGLIVYKRLDTEKKAVKTSEDKLDTAKSLLLQPGSEVIINLEKSIGKNLPDQIKGTIQDVVTTIDQRKLYKIKLKNVQPKQIMGISLDFILENVYFDQSFIVLDSKKEDASRMDSGWTILEPSEIKDRRFDKNQLNSIKFDRTGRYGFIVGKNGIILKTEDFGESWRQISVVRLDDIDLFAIAYSDNFALIAGSNGTIVKIRL